MNKGQLPKDLVVLVADADAEAAFRGLLERHAALGIREIDFEIFRHPERDPGVRCHAVEFLRFMQRRYRYALAVFDHEGCGSSQAPEELERDLETQLRKSGWEDRARVIVIAPELEWWVWGAARHLFGHLNLRVIPDELRKRLSSTGIWAAGTPKPQRPKEAFEELLYHCRRQRSAALFQHLAVRAGLSACTDRAFAKFVKTLREWFAS